MTPRNLLAIAALALVGCRTEKTVSAWEWADIDAIIAKKISVDDAPAVIVSREQRYLFQVVGNDSRSEVHTHEVLQLLSEAGFDRATVRLFWPKKGKLIHLDARSIAPDGTISVLEASQLFASEVKIDDKNEVDARFFHFPRVEVGSFVELAYTMELDGLYGSWTERVTDDLPILEYKVEIVVDEIAEPDLKIVNSGVKVTTETRDSMKHISFSLKDVPAAVDEDYAPSWKAREPWWLYRTVAYRFPNQLWYMNGDWDDVTDHLLPRLKGKGLDGAPRLDLSKCADGDDVCIITKANDKVRELTAFTGFDRAFDFQDVSETVDDRAASAPDKALLLYAILQQEGIDARLAAVARTGTNDVPRDFPSLTWLNHTLVVAVMGEAPNQTALWIDPSCEHCGPGFLPSWDPIGEPALLVWTKETARGKEHVVDWWTVAGQRSKVENVETRMFTVTIEDDGDAKVVLEETLGGEPALFWRKETRNFDDDDARRDARSTMLRFSRAALLDKWDAPRCEPVRGTCTRRIEATLPRFAHVSTDAVRVPLELFRGTVDMSNDEPRKTDVVVQTPWRGHDELKIVAPAGKRVAAAPEAWTASGPLVDISVSASLDGSTLIVKRDTRMSAGKLPKAEFSKIDKVLDRGVALTSSVVKIIDAPAAITP